MSQYPKDAFVSKTADKAFERFAATIAGLSGGKITAYRAFMAGWKARHNAKLPGGRRSGRGGVLQTIVTCEED